MKNREEEARKLLRLPKKFGEAQLKQAYEAMQVAWSAEKFTGKEKLGAVADTERKKLAEAFEALSVGATVTPFDGSDRPHKIEENKASIKMIPADPPTVSQILAVAENPIRSSRSAYSLASFVTPLFVLCAAAFCWRIHVFGRHEISSQQLAIKTSELTPTSPPVPSPSWEDYRTILENIVSSEIAEIDGLSLSASGVNRIRSCVSREAIGFLEKEKSSVDKEVALSLIRAKKAQDRVKGVSDAEVKVFLKNKISCAIFPESKNWAIYKKGFTQILRRSTNTGGGATPRLKKTLDCEVDKIIETLNRSGKYPYDSRTYSFSKFFINRGFDFLSDEDFLKIKTACK